LIGRSTGILLRNCGLLTSNISLSEFAIVGAVAYSTGVTRAISTALIVYELSGSSQRHSFPISIALLSSYFFSNRFTKNVYEVLIDTNRVPFLQELPRDLSSVLVHAVMTPYNNDDCLSVSSTFRDAVELVKSKSKQSDKLQVIPVVQCKASMIPVGAILKEDVRKKIRKIKKDNYDDDADQIIDVYSDILNEKIQYFVYVGRTKTSFKSLQLSTFTPINYSETNINTNMNDIFIDPSPYLIQHTSQLSKVDNVFRLLKLNHAFVTDVGRLVGVVTRENLRTWIGNRQKHPTERLRQLFDSTMNLFRSSHYTQIN